MASRPDRTSTSPTTTTARPRPLHPSAPPGLGFSPGPGSTPYPASRASSTLTASTDPRSARIQVWLEEVRLTADPAPAPTNTTPPALRRRHRRRDRAPSASPPPGDPQRKGPERILCGLRRLGRKLAGRDDGRDRAGGRPDRTAMYSLAADADAGSAGEGSSDEPVVRAMRAREERLERAARFLAPRGRAG